MLEALYSKWGSKVVTGEEPVKVPEMLNFINLAPALDLLHHHVINNSNIVVHCDVDMDGIGCGYILKRFLGSIMSRQQSFTINPEKEHGIKQRHLDYFTEHPIDLLIIVDSSTNEIDIIKQFNCDVIVFDHHEVLHSDLFGWCADGKHRYIIVNNMVDNNDTSQMKSLADITKTDSLCNIGEYTADARMSCGLVVYEALRVYQEAYKTGNLLENLMLYQWAGVTLFTDAIQLANDRNQWYIQNTIHSQYTEPSLMTMLSIINKFNTGLTNSNINYSLAPTFNRAIRAGASRYALYVALYSPAEVSNLAVYKDMQDNAIAVGTSEYNETDFATFRDLSGTGIAKNYTGVIASNLIDKTHKNSVCYIVRDGLAIGSFRGMDASADYRKQFEEYEPGIYAQGHSGAFGFKAPVEKLPDILKSLTAVENDAGTIQVGSMTLMRPYLTAGNIPASLRGKYHIDSIDEFRKQGGFVCLGLGNSNTSGNESIMITTMSTEAKLIETRGKLYLYDVLGITCKAFKEVEYGVINIYAEYSKNLEFFIK